MAIRDPAKDVSKQEQEELCRRIEAVHDGRAEDVWPALGLCRSSYYNYRAGRIVMPPYVVSSIRAHLKVDWYRKRLKPGGASDKAAA